MKEFIGLKIKLEAQQICFKIGFFAQRIAELLDVSRFFIRSTSREDMVKFFTKIG
jgi:hypothetical protein